MKLSDSLYTFLKWFCLVCIPALNTFLGILLPQVGVTGDTTRMIITIIAALGTFIGTLIGISTVAYNSEKKDEQ